MPDVPANGIRLEYETLGDPGAPALLLIMGLGAQLIDWPQEFCEQLAASGRYVIRFDNRDAGLSTSDPRWGVPDVPAILAGDRTTVPYLLGDLALDAVGLLDALGIGRAHVVGLSLGGMIAQQLTIDHPGRVASLCSVMSTTGDPTLDRPTPAAAAMLGRPPAADRETAIANSVAAARVVGSPAFPAAEEELLRRAAAKYDRSYRPLGTLRQYAAVLASPDRTEALGGVTVPTAVIHGAEDPLIPLSGGVATATAVPDAGLLTIGGMGHDLPRPLWSMIINTIVQNASRAAAC